MTSTFDLRTSPTWDSHNLVCDAFGRLADNDWLHLIYDYEPRPLRRTLEVTFSQRFRWKQRRVASDCWEVRVEKLASPPLYESTLHFMNRCPIFADVSETTKTTLAALAHARSVRRKITIAEQDANWPFLGLVRRGRAHAIAGGPTGRDQILFEIGETEIFGNLGLLDGGTTIARYATLTEGADLLLFPKASVLEATIVDSRFALVLAEASAQQTRAIVELVQARVGKKTVARVAAAIMPYAPVEFGLMPVDASYVASLRLGHIAKATGTVKEVVARAIAELETACAIRRMDGRIAFIDRQLLATLA